MNDSKKLVSLETVFEAAKILTENGHNPSVRNVKNYLGGGSPNEILAHLREWRAGRPQVVDTVIEVPEVTLNALRDAMSGAAEKASKIAEAKAAELEETVEDLRGEINDLAQLNTALNSEVVTHEKRIGQLSAENTKAVEQLDQVKATRRETEGRLSDERDRERQRAETLAEALSGAKNQLSNLAGIERERDELKIELAGLRNSLNVSEQNSAVAKSESDAERRRSEDAEKREDASLARLEKLESKLESERDESGKLREELAATKEKASQAQAHADELVKKLTAKTGRTGRSKDVAPQ